MMAKKIPLERVKRSIARYAASCVCVYLGAGAHRWCPMCRVLELFCRRIAR